MVEENRIQTEQCEDRLIFMSMYNDVDGTKNGNKEIYISNSLEVAAYAKRLPQGHWSFLGPGTKKSGMERTPTSQTVCGTIPRR